MTACAEAATESRTTSTEEKSEAIHFLQEALDLFQRCLNLQEYRYSQALANGSHTEGSPSHGHEVVSGEDSNTMLDADMEEIWASIEEPITKDILLDSVIAQLDTLASLSSPGPFNDHDGLAWIEEYYQSTLRSKANNYAETPVRKHEVALATAKLVCSLSDAAFQADRVDLLTYERELTAAFSAEDLLLTNDAQGLCDSADTELTFVESVLASPSQSWHLDPARTSSLCWRHITKALESLTAAAKLPGALNVPRIHIRRGDCEMLRFRLGEMPSNYQFASKSSSTLLKNAEVYYRNAGSFLENGHEGDQEREEAEVKEAVVLSLAGKTEKLKALLKARLDVVQSMAQEMVEEGLLGPKSARLLSEFMQT